MLTKSYFGNSKLNVKITIFIFIAHFKIEAPEVHRFLGGYHIIIVIVFTSKGSTKTNIAFKMILLLLIYH